jgi:hypothetical protein
VTVRTITWSHVPPGTQIEVAVAPKNGACISGGDIFMEDKGLLPVKQWTDGQLQPGPAIEMLKAGVDTTVDIRVVPAGAATVEGEIRAALRETSSGNVLDQQSRKFEVTPGTHDLVRIFADADPLTGLALAMVPVVTPRARAPTPSPAGPTRKRGK